MNSVCRWLVMVLAGVALASAGAAQPPGLGPGPGPAPGWPPAPPMGPGGGFGPGPGAVSIPGPGFHVPAQMVSVEGAVFVLAGDTLTRLGRDLQIEAQTQLPPPPGAPGFGPAGPPGWQPPAGPWSGPLPPGPQAPGPGPAPPAQWHQPPGSGPGGGPASGPAPGPGPGPTPPWPPLGPGGPGIGPGPAPGWWPQLPPPRAGEMILQADSRRVYVLRAADLLAYDHGLRLLTARPLVPDLVGAPGPRPGGPPLPGGGAPPWGAPLYEGPPEGPPEGLTVQPGHGPADSEGAPAASHET